MFNKRILFLCAGAAMLLPLLAQSGNENDLCWRTSFGRGAGMIPTACAPGEDMEAGLCYPKCRAGFTGVGPVCWSACPGGYRDDGAFCAKPQSYGRGAGYVLWDEKKCRAENGGNCEKSGALWYPVCKANFHAVGCCVCSPDCPAGLKDIGVSCAKQSYTRGAGKIPSCQGGQLSDAGLCYNSCPRDYDAVGPVCYSKCTPEFPFICGAGCSKSKETCIRAVLEMVTETETVAANIILTAAGAPGAGKAFTKAATSAGKAVYAFKFGYEALEQPAKRAATIAAEYFARQFALKDIYGVSVTGARFVGLQAANNFVREAGAAKASGQFDYTNFMIADPTGVSSLIYAFAKYGSCTVEDLAADPVGIDFGPEPPKPTDFKTIEVTVQSPTTITQVTSTPLQGCAIVPESDCIGKPLQPGEKCRINVKVTGGGAAIGRVRVYSTGYDVIPMSFPVRAAGANGAECGIVPGVDEAVNLTSLAGVWAWNNDVQKKVVVNTDGSVQSFRGAGQATILDPVKRTFAIKIGSSPAEFVELADHRQGLKLASGTPQEAVRLPWHPNCPPGDTFYAGLCYSVPISLVPTAPGFVGKPCPVDWRDDGTRCYPPWLGAKVNLQADSNGTFPMRHPILVTDCANYSQVKKQKCPTYFRNTGGPAGCTCEAIPMSREVRPLTGKIPKS